MASKVLFSDMAYDRYDADATLPARFGRMLDAMGMEEAVKGRLTAIKMHVGRGTGYSTIPPLFVKILVDKLKGYGAKVYITDQEVDGAKNRGYGEDYLGVPIVQACGVTGKYFYEGKVDFKGFKNVDIAGNIRDAEAMIDLSHVKGHGSCGYGGACKNLAMGCVTDRTRSQIHGLEGGLEWDASLCTRCELCISSCNHHANSFDKKGQYSIFAHNCTICQHCSKVCPTGAIKLNAALYEDFQKGMALCTKAVLDCFEPGRVFYVNFLMSITAVCDCWGMTNPSLVPDIGVMASKDIVAIERASMDMIKVENLIPGALMKGLELGTKGHLFERIHSKDPYVQLRELEAQGLGKQEYEIEKVQ
jgi:uncharacterized Fe-S center protein